MPTALIVCTVCYLLQAKVKIRVCRSLLKFTWGNVSWLKKESDLLQPLPVSVLLSCSNIILHFLVKHRLRKENFLCYISFFISCQDILGPWTDIFVNSYFKNRKNQQPISRSLDEMLIDCHKQLKMAKV